MTRIGYCVGVVDVVSFDYWHYTAELCGLVDFNDTREFKLTEN